MLEEIAVLLGHEESLTSLDDLDKLVIFHRINGEWSRKEVIQDFKIECNSVKDIQESIQRMITKLKDCKIILGTMITGVAFHILDRNGFVMCEADEYSDSILDQILNDQLKREIEINKIQRNPKELYQGPQMVNEEGVYFLDFMELKNTYPEISSKKAILPFLSKTVFYELKILCDHVMPWIDSELKNRNLQYEIEPYNANKLMITITHCVCDS
ncbi:Fe-only nitrogenase accessory AnfO family protein [Anaeromicropila herbilytica]|uniref:Fe-only nitrogenase accessory protein AnfO n=1 Tax=Anaeromicropila herbilytica TaxID=2785025 RepID=A0A7R7EPW9_9FIRM|nr:Fe-only nitrogenase accessory AnfO family protein [Anaeromicropila herbilytica]BCN32859.1 hypothetical protein bsdtb5_41540 [Anaeromicropila herbilytica]